MNRAPVSAEAFFHPSGIGDTPIIPPDFQPRIVLADEPTKKKILRWHYDSTTEPTQCISVARVLRMIASQISESASKLKPPNVRHNDLRI